MKYDAFLLLSYGSPERHADVVPFLERLFQGKTPPEPVLQRIVQQYREMAVNYGSFSPLGEQCREFLSNFLRSRSSVDASLNDLSVYWGNLFWHPLLEDTLAEMAADGVRNALVFVTSPFGSYFSRTRYENALQSTLTTLGPAAPRLDVFPAFATHRHYVRAVADRVLEAAAYLRLELDYTFEAAGTKVLFTAHSLPLSDPMHEAYDAALHEAAREIMSLIQGNKPREEDDGAKNLEENFHEDDAFALNEFLPWKVVYQSRSESSREAWLAPDLDETIRELAHSSQPLSLILVPLGFLLENKETVYDLDFRAMGLCEELQIPAVRAATAGASPPILQMIFDELLRR